LGLNLGIAAANIIAYSLIDFWASSLAMAFGGTVIFLSAVGVTYGNYRLFAEPEGSEPEKSIPKPEYYSEQLKEYCEHKTFGEDINRAIDQITRLQRKIEKIQDLLEQKFDGSEITLERFLAGVTELMNAFLMNIKIFLNKLDTFDDFDITNQADFSDKIIKDKREVLDIYVASIKSAIERNEQILVMLDKLLLEISNMDCPDKSQWDIMIEKFDIIIKQITKFRN
jgi:signal transduction histidine kinase